jgi:hypothetical protein
VKARAHPKRGKRAALAALFAFLAAFAGIGQPQAQPAVARPEVKVGDRWVYQRTDHRAKPPVYRYELQVSFVDARAIHTVLVRQGKRRESDATWTPEWNGVVAVDEGVVELERGLLGFPLAVGAQYRAAWQMRRARAGAFLARHERQVRVAGWEDVEVPAGRFRALRIEANGTWQRLDRKTSDWARNTVWYAPQAKRWVKTLYEDAHGKIGEELVFYVIQ